MQTICLVIPPSEFLLDARVFPFLGILRVGEVLRRSGYAVDTLDLSGYSNFTDIVADYIVSGGKAQHFGITATTPQMPTAAKVIATIRALRPDARIILGGPHATLVTAAKQHEDFRKKKGRASIAFAQLTALVDTVVAGEGERAIFEALKVNAPQLIDADDRKSQLWINDDALDALPFPARDLIDLKSYHYKIDGKEATSLIAQLGCPMPCEFCGGRLSPTFRVIRTRSVESIVREMVELHQKYGYRGFMFYDDELNVRKDKMIPLMEEITKAQRDLNVTWALRGFIKSELFTEAQGRAMARAGFKQILVGFESGSPRILKNIKKQATREENSRCVEIARQCGITVKALMSLGHPGESHETAEATRQWLLEARPADFDVSIITPYPGTPYYDRAEQVGADLWVFYAENGDRLFQHPVNYMEEADYYKGDPDKGYVSHVHTDYLTREEVVIERDRLERSVRGELGIPFNQSAAAVFYEHSMGQPGLPSRVFRTTTPST